MCIRDRAQVAANPADRLGALGAGDRRSAVAANNDKERRPMSSWELVALQVAAIWRWLGECVDVPGPTILSVERMEPGCA